MTNVLPKTGQQVVLTPDNRVETREFDIRPPQSDEVLIETTRTLISAGTELGTQELARRADRTPGYSNAGRIAAVGATVRDYQIGDRVLSLGGHASHVISPTLPHALRPVPAEVTDEQATFGVLGSVAMYGVRKAHIELGEHVLVTGMGLVGQLVLGLAAGIRSETLVAVDLVDERLEKAQQRGASHIVNPNAVDFKAEVDRITGARGLDVVIEASGYPDVLPNVFDCCRVGGRILLLGSIWNREVLINFRPLHLKELVLIGCHQPKCPIQPTSAYPWTQQHNREQILAMIADGRLDVSSLISHRMPYTSAPEAYRLLRDQRDQALGVILTWGD